MGRLFISFFLSCFLLFPLHLCSQTFQLHYDFRQSPHPARNQKNSPTLVFEEWKSEEYGSFDFKTQTDLSDDGSNIGELYVQAQQSLRFWTPNIFNFVEFSGGIGVVDPELYGYHIADAYSLGGSYLFFWNGAWSSSAVVYKYSAFRIAGHDVMLSQYWGRNFWDDQITFAGDLEIRTENRNHGDTSTSNRTGKQILFYGEPQMW